ncbi:MAG: hypothetical protein JWR73_3182 [Tardiphaga sp.]|nr:hypothetical protein [Tardiphaga sp.]
MSRKRDRAAIGPEAQGAHSTVLAEEDSFDRRALLRLGAWSIAAISAVVIAMLSNQSSLKLRRDELANSDLARQAQQMQLLNQQTQGEARRLASAIETLNSDRDRLYSRVSTLEQGLDSVTGSIGRQAAVRPMAAAIETPPAPAPAASIPARDTMPASSTPLMASKSLMAPPDPAAARLDALADVVASAPAAEPEAVPVSRSAFGIDLGIAPSIEGLRALWRQISAAHPALAGLTPLLVVKERPGAAGMQLRLVAGPLRDATSAAQICAALPAGRLCEPAAYDGQRLTLGGDATAAPPAIAPKPVVKRKPKPKPPAQPAAATPPAAIAPPPTSLLRG